MKPNWFVAFPVDAGDWYTPWLGEAPEKTRAFHPDDLHVTLAFFGGVEAEAALSAWRSLETLTLPSALTATWRGVEPFGHPKKPSAFALTPERGRDALIAALTDLANPLLATAGREPERRAPRPHATVVRPERKANTEQRRAILQWAEDKRPPTAAVELTELALYTWSDDRKTRKFKIVERIALPTA